MIGFVKARVAPSGIAWHMSRRAIQQRYRGSVLGVAWAFLTPLFMLVVYTFIFTRVFTVRWGQEVGDGTVGDLGTFEFAILLFAGLSLYAFFSEVVLAAGSAITSNANYVKKVIFPLRILPVVAVASALFQLLVALLILLAFQFALTQSLPWTVLLAPLAIIPLIVLVTGLGWLLAGLGTYLQDLNQVLGPLVTALLFLGPILYPMSSFSEDVRPLLAFNPLTIPVEAFRDLTIWGQMPDWSALGIYSVVAVAFAVIGWICFTRMRPGFADVL
ncbi:MAG: ABC transporter permease [Pseudomonadota bacterium]